MTLSKPELRTMIRAQRRDLGPARQKAAAAAVAERLARWIGGLPPGKASASVATDGELDPGPTVRLLRACGWVVAFPRIDGPDMSFHLAAETTLVRTRLGLAEPRPDAPEVAPADLDLVLVPLVAFDSGRNRIGRGRAYYDRTFAFLGQAARPSRPWLIGLAHDLQQVDRLEAAPHDISLDAVATPSAIHGDLPAP